MKYLAFALAVLLAATLAPLANAQGPAVTIVTGSEAPELEQFAAKELADQFQTLFQAERDH